MTTTDPFGPEAYKSHRPGCVCPDCAAGCPAEAVFGPDDRVPCLLERGHEGPHRYAPQPCEQCGCLPDAPWGCGCSNEDCPCSEVEDEECE